MSILTSRDCNSTRYHDFDMYQSDFESIRSVLEETGKGRYHMYGDKGVLNYYKDRDGHLTPVAVPLSESQKESLYNIVEYTKRSTQDYITRIKVADDYIAFFEETSGWGVMYTDDIKSSLKSYNDGRYNDGKNHFSYKHIKGNWYEIVD